MCTLHLNKVYCLTSLSYGCETWTLNEQSIKRVNVAWNNSFWHIFGGFLGKSVKSLQFFSTNIRDHAFLSRMHSLENADLLLCLAQLTSNKGILFANDANVERAKAIIGNIHRMGIVNCVVSTYDGRQLPKVKQTHTRLTTLFPGLPGSAGTRKVRPIWILLNQETVSGSGISWAICKSASRSRQITMPVPHHSKVKH